MKLLAVFYGIILFLGISQSVLVGCPVCGGTGHLDISKLPGLENTRILNVKTFFTIVETCGMLVGHIVSVNVLMANEGSHEARGNIVITAKEHDTGKVLFETPVRVNIAAGTQRSVSMVRTVFTYAEQIDVSVGMPSGFITCPNCSGEGEVAMFEWLVQASPMGSKLAEFS